MAVRVRHHVNPLSQRYQQPADIPDWTTVYANWSRSLHVDIGCARGLFLFEMARQCPDWNFLGLEIRRSLVEQANELCQQEGLKNLYFLFCNANISLQPILATCPIQGVDYVTIQFPDPWFKKRHQKRRVVQPELVQDLADGIKPGGQLLIQSDVEEVAIDMRDRIAEHPDFQPTTADWLPVNPLPVPTEREISTLEQGEPVYRQLFDRRKA